ncbi:MAG: hypothetical protein K8963_03815 [Proteobacteria bacterium]|nr:hypothetical protein [Pseudomonadota bacterium]
MLATLLLVAVCYAVLLVFRLAAIARHVARLDGASPAPPLSASEIIARMHSQHREHKLRRFELMRLLAHARRTLDVTPNPVVVADKNHEMVWCNAACAKLLRIEFPRDRGLSVLSLIRDGEFENALDQLSPGNHYDQRQLKLSVRPGVVLSVRLHYLWHGLKMVHLQDVSETEGLMEAQRKLIANFSHEIKTPLTLIQGYVDIIDEKTGVENDRIVRIRELIGRIDRLAQDNIARLRAALEQEAPEEQSPAPVSIAQWTQDYIDNCRSAGLLLHPIETTVEPDLTIHARPRELDSIFANLLNNARYHTPAGTPITVKAFRQYDDVIFEVTDAGPGIPEHQIDHLTEMFYQYGDRAGLNSRRDNPLTHGMGLHIVENLLRRCRGSLTIQSALGKGSTFRCRIPASSADEKN